MILMYLFLCVNDDVLYDYLTIDLSSCGFIPTEFVTLKTFGDGNCFGNLELRDLDRQESTWV